MVRLVMLARHLTRPVTSGTTPPAAHFAPLPLTITGSLGGRAVFLDTGWGKGGRLLTADLRFGDDGGLHLKSFMMH